MTWVAHGLSVFDWYRIHAREILVVWLLAIHFKAEIREPVVIESRGNDEISFPNVAVSNSYLPVTHVDGNPGYAVQKYFAD